MSPTTAIVVTIRPPAPSPWRARNAISELSDHASPSSSELTVKRRIPAMKSRAAPQQVGEPAAE